MMPFFLLLLAGMGSVNSILRKYNISGTIYFTTENEVDKVMPNMEIHLKDRDGRFDKDDDLGQAVTDEHGHFEGLVGEEDEEEEQEPYLSIPLHHCSGDILKGEVITKVWLPSTPERQNVSIYLGYKDVAYLHREGQKDLALEIPPC